MKKFFSFTILSLLSLCMHAQTTITFYMKDAVSEKTLPGVNVTIPGKITNHAINDATRTITNLEQYDIHPNDLIELRFTKTGYEDRKELFRVQTNSNIVDISLMPSNAVTKGDKYFIRGVVKSSDSSLLRGVAIILREKDYKTTSDQFGYYNLIVPVNKIPSTYKTLNVSFSYDRKHNAQTIAIPLNKNKFDYHKNVVMQTKNTTDTLKGHVLAPKRFMKGIEVTLYNNGREQGFPVLTNEEGQFRLPVDTAEINPADSLKVRFNREGLRDTVVSFSLPQLRYTYTIEIPYGTVPRSGHSLSGTIAVFPAQPDFIFYAGYQYYPSFAKGHACFGANLGIMYFQVTLPNDNPVSAFTYKDTFTTLYFGLMSRYFLKPYNSSERYNPFAELSVYYGSTKNLNYGDGQKMAQLRSGVGMLVNINSTIVFDVQAQITFNRFSYDAPILDPVSERVRFPAKHSFTQPYFGLQFDFMIPLE